MRRTTLRLAPLWLACAALFACKKDPPRPPPLPAGGSTTRPAPHAPVPATELSYRAPPSWSAQPPASPMRKAQFVLPGSGGAASAELIVFHFPGTGGSVEDNITRWYTQFQQPDGSESARKAQTAKLTVNGLPVRTVYLTGTYLKPKNPMAMMGPTEPVPNQAMLAAIVETASGPWFFKAVGPQATVDAHRAAFDEFVKTFQVKR
jgi:hypothetical protein